MNSPCGKVCFANAWTHLWCGSLTLARRRSWILLIQQASHAGQLLAFQELQGGATAGGDVGHLVGEAQLSHGSSGGTIVDVPFLTRQIIRNISVDRYKNTGVSAYLVLPSACGSEADPVRKQKGDRNAYAALKEIDSFMGLQNRGEASRQQYGTFDVEISENIFDFCTLVEGVADGRGVDFDLGKGTACADFGATARAMDEAEKALMETVGEQE